MAYQPIQVSFPTTPTGLAGGIGDGIDAFMHARQQSIANEQARAEALLRRQQFDEAHLRNSQIDARANRQIATEEENNRRKNAIEDRTAAGARNTNIRKAFLMARDRPIEAAAILQQEGVPQADIVRITREAQDDDAATLAGGAPAPAARMLGQPGMPPQQMGGPGPTPAQFGPPRPPQFGPPPAPPPGPQLPSGPPPSQAAGLAPPPMQQDATGLPTGAGQEAPVVPPPQAAPQMAAPATPQGPPPGETPAQANVRRARILRFHDPKSGQEVTFDRDEDARATAIEKQRAFAQLDAGIQQYGESAPHIAKYLSDAKALLSSDAIKPQEVGAWIKDMYKTDQMAYATLHKPAGAMQMNPYQVANAQDRAFAQFQTNVDKWRDREHEPARLDEYQKLNVDLGSARDAYNKTGDTIGQHRALYALARYITGPGVLTKEEYANTVQNTAGIFQKLISDFDKYGDGSLGPGEWAAVEKAVGNFQQLMHQKGIHLVKSFDNEITTNRWYSERGLSDQVDRVRENLAARFGIDPAELPTPNSQPTRLTPIGKTIADGNLTVPAGDTKATPVAPAGKQPKMSLRDRAKQEYEAEQAARQQGR